MHGLRTTLARPVQRRGIGFHSGKEVTVVLKPGVLHAGRVFVRVDRPGRPRMGANLEHVYQTARTTCLRTKGGSVATIEHLMAAISSLEIDDVEVEIDGPEIPALDGSAHPWVEALEEAGRIAVPGPRSALRLVKRLQWQDGGQVVMWLPSPKFMLDVYMDFQGLGRSPERWRGSITPGSFTRELAPARMFGFEHEVISVQSRGLAAGASPSNLLTLRGNQVISDNQLRFPDEPIRHRALNALGDLALLEVPIIGTVRFIQADHAFYVEALRHLLTVKDAWEWEI